MADNETIDFSKVRAKFSIKDNGVEEGMLGGRRGAPVGGWCIKFWQSRFSGWPVAMIFGLYVYYLLTFVVLDTAVNVEIKKQVDKSDINASVISQIKQGVDMNCATHTDLNKTDQINTTALEDLRWTHQKIGMSVGGGTCAVLGISSCFSTGMRCYMLLIIPGLFAGRGRSLLMTISVGLLLDGPIANLNTNIQLVTKAFLCMYEQMKGLACRYKASYSNIFENVINTLQQIHEETERRLKEIADEAINQAGAAKAEAEKAKREMEKKLKDIKEKIDNAKEKLKGLNVLGDVASVGCKGVSTIAGWFGGSVNCDGVKVNLPDIPLDTPDINLNKLVEWARDLNPHLDPLDINTLNVGDLLQSQSISNIRDKLINATKRFFEILQYVFSNIKLGFYMISVVYMLFRANQYLVQYLSNDSYDNMFVNETLDDGYNEKLLPLRNWELKEKYQMISTRKCVKLSKEEYKRIGLLVTPSLLFFLTTIGIIMADYLFASFIDVLKEHGKFGISFNGMEQGIELNGLLTEAADGEIPILNLKLEAFDLSTDPCLPVPVRTDWIQLAPLVGLVAASLISCFLDAYIQRLRSQICNLFYPKRAKDRTVYLRRRISTGRGRRFYQLKLVSTQRKNQQDQLLKNSYWYQFKNWFQGTILRSSMTKCHGCEKKVKQNNVVVKDFHDVTVNICEDCKKDI